MLTAFMLPTLAYGQLMVDDTQTPEQLVQNILLGQGVTATNITFNGAAGNVVNEQAGSFGNGVNTFLGIPSGLLLATGSVNYAVGPNNQGSGSEGGGNWDASDPDLAMASAVEVRDAAVLEFDFIPTGDSLKFDFIFGSDEYPEFACSGFNDVFGFFLSGPGITGPFSNNAANIALIPGSQVPIAINTVNAGVAGASGQASTCAAADPNWTANSIYYIANGDGFTTPQSVDPHYVQYDGYTTVITARAQVICGETYHIKIAVADAGDTGYDSAVFLKEGSFASTTTVAPQLGAGLNVNDSTMYEGCGPIPFSFIRTGDTSYTDTVHLTIGGTATAGVDYFPALPIELIYAPGDTLVEWPLTVPFDADGMETLTITITQNVICSGQTVQSDFVFYITQPDPLGTVTNDIAGLCGETHVLAPGVSGGIGDYRFNWSTGETTPTITVTPELTTTYYFTVGDTCSVETVQDSITITIPVYPALTIEVSDDIAIDCLEEENISVVASGGNGNYTYAWSANGLNEGSTATISVPAGEPTYYVVVVNEGCGEVATDSVLVTTVPLPAIEVMAHDTTVFCAGDTVTLGIPLITGGNGVYTYTWSTADGTVIGVGPSLTVGVPVNAIYTLGVSDQCGNEGSGAQSTLVPIREPFVLEVTPDTVICAGESVEVKALVSGGSGVYTIDWVGLGISDPHHVVPGVESGIYPVVVIDGCGERLRDSVEVEVQYATAQILYSNQGEDDWLFQSAVTPPFPQSIKWDLGDSTTSRRESVLHSYLDLRSYWVHLWIVTPEGCKAQDSVLIHPPGSLFFPNAFTPDGDGINETFMGIGHSIAEFEMEVFDRWGHLVFSTDQYGKAWDGKVLGGAEATTGVYVYRYRAKGHYFEAQDGYGHVTLLRGATQE